MVDGYTTRYYYISFFFYWIYKSRDKFYRSCRHNQFSCFLAVTPSSFYECSVTQTSGSFSQFSTDSFNRTALPGLLLKEPSTPCVNTALRPFHVQSVILTQQLTLGGQIQRWVVKVILFVSLWAALLNTVLVMLLLQHDCTLPLPSLYSSHPTIRVGRDLSCRLRFAAHSVMAFLSSTITSFSFLLPYVTASSPLCSSTVPSRPFAFITAKSSVFLSFL